MDREASLRTEALEIDPRRIVHETVDDETIIIDFDSGSYFSLTGSGPEIWGLIAAGATVDQIGEELERRYPGAGSAETVPGLVERLVDEGLVVAGREADGSAVRIDPVDGSVDGFAEPVLTKFTDLQELLLLDPIHEIDESGWPHTTPS